MGCTRNLSGFISAESPVTPPFIDDVGVITSLLWVGPAVFALPLCLPPHLSFHINVSSARRGRRREKKRKKESNGERNNISIPSSLRNLGCSKSNPTTAKLHCIKDVSWVADMARQTCDGIILAKSDSTVPGLSPYWPLTENFWQADKNTL